MSIESVLDYAILSRAAFDELVEGNPQSWRECVQAWRSEINFADESNAKQWEKVQLFLDESHDLSICSIDFQENYLKVSFSTKEIIEFVAIKDIRIVPPNEELPFALLYGELRRIADCIFVHLLCDAIDIYIVCLHLNILTRQSTTIAL